MTHNRFSTRPLFSVPKQEIALNGAQHCQLRPDARLTSHVSFFRTYLPDHYQVFLINDQLYTFENFTLTQQSNHIFRIYPNTYKFSLQTADFDFTEADLEIPPANNFEDHISTLKQINSLQVNQAALQHMTIARDIFARGIFCRLFLPLD